MIGRLRCEGRCAAWPRPRVSAADGAGAAARVPARCRTRARFVSRAMLDIKSSADYLSRSGTFTNFSMLFAGDYLIHVQLFLWRMVLCVVVSDVFGYLDICVLIVIIAAVFLFITLVAG